MRILVAVKPTLDINQLKFEKDGTPMVDASPVVLGDADKCAIEEAVKAKEGLGARTSVVSVGSTAAHYKAIRDAYAMGVDEGYIVKVDGEVDALTVARLIAGVAKRSAYDLLLMGSGAGDTHASLVGPMVAGLMGVPLIAGVDRLEISGDGAIRGTCALGDGTYIYEARAPSVVTVTSEANQPRIPNLKAVLRSKSARIEELTPSDLGVETRRLNLGVPKKYEVQRRRVKLEAADADAAAKVVDKLLEALRSEGILS
ncbi:MAG: electron transfer flavoprotein subunit beta/FixA family protein [Conexivisphaera sp.]